MLHIYNFKKIHKWSIDNFYVRSEDFHVSTKNDPVFKLLIKSVLIMIT